MSKKVYNLVCGIVTGVEVIAEAVCGYVIADPFIKGAVLASIPVFANAIIVICGNFKRDFEN